jgi:uncharacterized protein YdeI (YjbR/CyaY-like superfamily)
MPKAAPTFFPTPRDFRAWLQKHHRTETELLVGFYRKSSGKPSITWQDSVDQALCFGWIDGVRRTLGPDSYTIRFTPRRPASIWSAINIGRARELTTLGQMKPAGLAAFARRSDDRSAIYAYEQRKEAAFDPAQRKRLAANAKAFAFFEAQPPGYRKLMMFWVTSAKKPETRAKRLARLIRESAAARRVL